MKKNLFFVFIILSFIPAFFKYEVPTEYPFVRDVLFNDIKSDIVYSQTFTADNGQLTAIDILILPDPVIKEGYVNISLLYANVDLPALASTSIPVSELKGDRWTRFSFDPVRFDVRNNKVFKELIIKVEFKDVIRHAEPMLILGKDSYGKGNFRISNKNYQDLDMAFVPIYSGNLFSHKISIFQTEKIVYILPIFTCFVLVLLKEFIFIYGNTYNKS